MFSAGAYSPRVFLSFMENSPAQWWMKDSAGRYLFVNNSFAKFWHKRPDYFVGKTDFDFMSSMTAQALRANDQVVIESQTTIHIHEMLDGPDGKHIFFIVKFPFNENGVSYCGGIGFDVTEGRRAQLELDRARDQVLEASALKSAFLASVQHELRTPLAGIIGMNELLLLTSLDDDQRHLAQTVQDSSQALLTVLNDILDLSKIESGRLGLSPTPFSIRHVAEDSVRLMMAAARSKKLGLSLAFDASVPETVIGDAERLRQLLLNLLSNAIKFTEVGFVELVVRLAQLDEEQALVHFLVKDSGIGIPSDKQPYLFMPFWQADMGDTRAYGGQGLGLPLSKHIVEKMGADGIHVKSEPGQGSEFSFDIPFPLRGAVGETVVAADVLVVEDNRVLASSILKEFEALGMPAEAVATSAQAIEKIRGGQYHLVLCDQILPDADAVELIERVRLHESKTGAQRVPIVVMSSAPNVGDKERMLSTGADDYVSKPLATEQLWRLVNLWRMI